MTDRDFVRALRRVIASEPLVHRMVDRLESMIDERLAQPDPAEIRANPEYVAGGAVFLDPTENPPPRGKKILLLTEGGVCVIGHWSDDCLAWHPLPRVKK